MQKAVGSTPAAAEALVQLAAHSSVQDDVLTHVVYMSLLMHVGPKNPYEVHFPPSFDRYTE